jgi:hypothetical protein
LQETGTSIVSIEPMTSIARSGETFKVSVVISDAVNLGASQFTMGYDPEVVRIDGVELGSFPSSSGRNASPLGPKIDNEEGSMSFGSYSFGTAPGADGGGLLADITLTAQGTGDTNLDLKEVQILGPLGQPQQAAIADGAAIVEGRTRFYLPLILCTH